MRFDTEAAGEDAPFFMTVDNLFDRDPPIIPTKSYGGYRSTKFSLYDVVGRYPKARLQAKF